MNKGLILLTMIFSFLLEAAGQIPLAREKVIVTNERRVNTAELEFSPAFYKDGIVFISTHFESLIYNVKDTRAGGKNLMSIYHARRSEDGFLFDPEPLANELIFRYHEGPVSFDRTAESIFFTRNEPSTFAVDGLKKLQVYTARKVGLTWTNIGKLPFNKIDFNYEHPSISPDEDVMYISSDQPGGYGGMDIYAVYPKNGLWIDMVNLGEEVNGPGNEVFPFIAADGALYFSSDREGSMGKLDIFYTKKRGHEWRRPVNLGVPFNSMDDDLGFIVDRDNKNGYFSSDRKGGFGNDDIYSFYIEGHESSIAGPLFNLDGLIVIDEQDAPIEGALVSAIHLDELTLTGGTEGGVRIIQNNDGSFSFNTSSDSLYLSARTNSEGKIEAELQPGNYILKGSKDGYLPAYLVITPDTDFDNLRITLKRAVDCVALTGKVLMKKGAGQISGATVSIVDIDTKETFTVYTDQEGNYVYCLKCNKTYAIYARKNNASSELSITSTLAIPCTDSATIDLPLFIDASSLLAGMTISLPNIYFNFDDSNLRPDAYQDLNEVVAMLTSYPDMKLELASHTDSRGTNAYNLDLSLRRSTSVYNYLISKGIDTRNLTKRGYGESHIRNRCVDGVSCTESEHKINRRTEIKIISLGDEGKEALGSISPKEYQEVNIKTKEDAPFTVVAGTFANQDNALRRMSLLTSLGFAAANITQQTRNGLFAVFVNSFDEQVKADELVQRLAKHQVDAYVLRY